MLGGGAQHAETRVAKTICCGLREALLFVSVGLALEDVAGRLHGDFDRLSGDTGWLLSKIAGLSSGRVPMACPTSIPGEGWG